MNIVVHCDTGVAFWMSKNVSSDVHDRKFIFDFVDNAIGSEAGPGEENVVQVVTDNASNNMTAAKMLAMKRPHIFWTSCAAHIINLLLASIARIKQIRNVITLGRTLTVFRHTISLDLLRQFTKDLDSLYNSSGSYEICYNLSFITEHTREEERVKGNVLVSTVG